MDRSIGEKEYVLEYLGQHRKELLEQRDRLLAPIQKLDQEIEHVTATMRSLQQPTSRASSAVAEEFPVGKLRKLTQVQALVVIAKHYGGTFKAQEAKRLLIKAGVMRETKNSTNIIHAVILRSEKFERVRPGEYRLKTDNSRLASADKTTLNELFPASKPVQ
jgi:hypothetical protein